MAILRVTNNPGWGLLQKAESVAANYQDGTDALAAIVLSFSAMEAFVSELEWLCGREQRVPQMAQLGVFLEALESNHAPIKNKLDAVALIATGKRAEWGRAPLQDLSHLKILRDWGVHPKPVVGSSDKDVEDSP